MILDYAITVAGYFWMFFLVFTLMHSIPEDIKERPELDLRRQLCIWAVSAVVTGLPIGRALGWY